MVIGNSAFSAAIQAKVTLGAWRKRPRLNGRVRPSSRTMASVGHHGGTAMTAEPTIVGIDLGKNWFHLIGLDARGATVLRRKVNRLQLAEYAATAPRGVVATESCPGSQYWGRVFTKAGHEVRILPAQFVKPYLKANKNDFNDAEAIAEAAGRASMRWVPLKTNEQLELQALHRVRRRFIIERTAVV